MKQKNKDLPTKVAIQSLLRPDLTPVYANKDYFQFVATINCIDKIIRTTGIEEQIMQITLERFSSSIQSVKALSKKVEQAIKAFRTETLRCLLGQDSFRKLSVEISKSDLLADFCMARSLLGIKGVSKSSLDRNAKLFCELELSQIHQQLTKNLMQGGAGDQMPTIKSEEQYVDTTCVEANIHYPTDWVCLKDYCHSVLKSIEVIRKHGILNRIPKDIKDFKVQVNHLCIEMTHARRVKGSKQKRKQVLRELKKLTAQIGKHGKKHLIKLQESWEESSLSQKQKDCIAQRLDSFLQLEGRIVKQAHERIIGGRKVKNEEKILSIYDLDLEVLKRGKAGKEVEFGNKFYLSENEQGYILDFALCKGNPDDRAMLKKSLYRQDEAGYKQPKSICADRGFNGGKIVAELEKKNIVDESCPKDVSQLQEKLKDPDFVRKQKRRASTEGRIGILKSKFSLNGLRSQGYQNRSRSCVWAVISHNLWLLSRQILEREALQEAA